MRFSFLYIAIAAFFISCAKEEATLSDYNGFPDEAGRIIKTKCATPGCHNTQSKEAAGGLDLSSWDKMFGGDEAVVIPYRSDYSTMFYYTNSFSDLGLTLTPRMPYNKEPLTREEVLILKNWIDGGAYNSSGFVKFSDNPLRKKFYVTNQGCDVVTVFDSETLLPMRYINVGNSVGVESPHMIKVSPDGLYWYVIFTGGNSIQKYRTSDDSYVGEINIGSSNWNTFSITSDSKTAYMVSWISSGIVLRLDLENLTVLNTYSGSGLFNYPHGSCVSANDDSIVYITAQTGNFVYKIDLNYPNSPSSPDISQVSLQTGIAPASVSSLDIHEVAFTSDGSLYFATCQTTNEVRVMQASNDSLLAVIPTGIFPSEMGLDESQHLLFVTCPEDTVIFPGKRGCVSIIDYQSRTLVKHLYTGHQPHGIAVDNNKGLVYVANRNYSSGGPAPHHGNLCGGNNGYVSYIDLNSLTLTDLRTEISVDPYSVAVRK